LFSRGDRATMTAAPITSPGRFSSLGPQSIVLFNQQIVFRDLAAKIMYLCVGTAFRTVSDVKPTSFVTGQLILQFDPLCPKAFDIGQRH
jgi:hypothetical protein